MVGKVDSRVRGILGGHVRFTGSLERPRPSGFHGCYITDFPQILRALQSKICNSISEIRPIFTKPT